MLSVERIDIEKLDKQIDLITSDLPPFIKRGLKKVPPQQAQTIVDFIMAMEVELNPVKETRLNYIAHSYVFSRFNDHKLFKDMTRDDLLGWLLSGKKSEEKDPKHRWIGSYNKKIDFLKKFYRWLYYPDVDRETRIKDRPMPPQITNVRKLRRKEKSTYSGSDMWKQDDDTIFLKYCPSKMIRAWHMMDDDMSGRPKELTRLSIGEVKRSLTVIDGVTIGEVMVTGKTGQRSLPLYRSVPYTIDWLNDHPLKDNDEAPFFIDVDSLKPVTPQKLNGYYRRYKIGYKHKGKHYQGYFPRLLKDPSVPLEDKAKIEALLKKPWNPYVFRHSALSEKAPKLAGPLFKQHSGHTPGSKIPDVVYVHLLGGESSKAILEAEGVIKKDRTTEDILKPKVCTNCNVANTVHAIFCQNCRQPLNLEGVKQLKEKQERDLKNAVRQVLEEMEVARHGIKQEESGH